MWQALLPLCKYCDSTQSLSATGSECNKLPVLPIFTNLGKHSGTHWIHGLKTSKPSLDPGVLTRMSSNMTHWNQFVALRYAHTGAQRTEQTDAAHGDKIFFPLLVTYHRTLIRTRVRQFRPGFWEGNLFPSGRRVRLTQRWSYRIVLHGVTRRGKCSCC